jgi:hypothetical protein
MPVIMTLSLAAACAAALLFLLAKSLFLAPLRAEWAMVVANTIYETAEKRFRSPRALVDAAVFVTAVGLFALSCGFGAALAASIVMSLAWVASLCVDVSCRSDVPADQHRGWPRVPLPVPRLAMSIRGPVLKRRRGAYVLGDWPIGLRQQFELLILNPTTVRPQLPLDVRIESGSPALELIVEASGQAAPEPGEVVSVRFCLSARSTVRDARVMVRVIHGDREWARTLVLRSSFSGDSVPVERTEVKRWRHGCNAAFAWRGDHDLYDPSTFQSETGLRLALGLARRFRMPTTVMMSSRLSLEQAEHEEFCAKFGWDRRSAEIPSFIRFMRDHVDMSNEQEFPTSTVRPFAAEIGNHMHLHYGTHAAADPGNGWKSHVRSGAGTYDWMSRAPCTSFEEQRDNLLACGHSIRRHLGVEATSFAIPSDFYDSDTSRAVEAAGIEVGNDTDSSKFERQFVFPPEHHPAGCERLAELTRMSPRDPVNAFQLAMLKYWVGFARRNRRALVYLAHHHLLMYQGHACYAMTAGLLHHVVGESEGDVHSATVTALGRYWRDVLSERTRVVSLSLAGGTPVAENRGQRLLSGIPVEIEFAGGRAMMRIVDLPPGRVTDILGLRVPNGVVP